MKRISTSTMCRIVRYNGDEFHRMYDVLGWGRVSITYIKVKYCI
jgi:hypothetical protein